MGKPLFSVIIPVYKVRRDYFDTCVQSVLHQSFGNIEIILVDDGCPDTCGKVCDEYAQQDRRIRVVHQCNQGVSVARNNGIKAAIADWIIFVDADDWLELAACERLKGYLESGEYDILLFNATKEYADRQQKLNYGFENGHVYDATNVDIREFLYRRAMQTPNAGQQRVCPVYYSWDKVFKREFLIQNNLQYPSGLPKSEDKVFILSCFEKLGKLFYVDDILYHYRINTESVCNRYSASTDMDRILLVRLLGEISKRMDKVLGELKCQKDYCLITNDYERFVFGIISDVLFLKFYHPDCPYDKAVRVREAKEFINTEPFKSSIRRCRYRDLTNEAKLKKLLLSMNMITFFCYIRYLYRRLKQRSAEE